ncbi:MAG TPA: zinc ribbon domain-containing protein [Gemmatimonadaceae bacterium]|nr:zinc ribbon domain-containing protein [Gemmatimonadaceae bacterium]
MPTYEYRCPEGHGFERFYRKMSDAVPELACPQCGKIAERQLTGGAGLVFKGSGFYLTDYGKNAHRKGAPAPSSGEKGGDAGGEGKAPEKASGESSSEAKPASGKPAESSGTSGTAAAAKSTTPKSDK